MQNSNTLTNARNGHNAPTFSATHDGHNNGTTPNNADAFEQMSTVEFDCTYPRHEELAAICAYDEIVARAITKHRAAPTFPDTFGVAFDAMRKAFKREQGDYTSALLVELENLGELESLRLCDLIRGEWKTANIERTKARALTCLADIERESKSKVDAKPAVSGAGLIKRLADEILHVDHIAQNAGGKAYIFRDGVYQDNGEVFIKQRVKRLLLEWSLSKKWSSNLANEVARYILVDAPKLWEKPPLNQINVKNGLLNPITRALAPHSPDFLSAIQLPVTYNPDATCPHWQKFVAVTFPEDAYAIAFQIVAWLMTPDTTIQKAVLVLGEGSNGKSTWLTGLSAFIGSANIANLSLQALDANKFARPRIIGKLANICPDLPSAHLADTGIFKQITGGDPISGEYKYGQDFDFKPFSRLVFSANQPPRSSDATHAFFRRWLVIPFNRTFEGKEVVQRDVMDARLADTGELSGLLNLALEALPQLRANGFSESISMREAWNELRQTTDPLAVWLDTATTEAPEGFATKRALCQAYNHSGKSSDRAFMSENAFGRALRRHRPNLKDGQKTIGGAVVWVWHGLELRE